MLDAVSPGPGEHFDPAMFLRKHGTLYLLGTASGASATAGLVAALVEDVVEVARRLAAGSPGGRLDPPLGLILDEAANYPLPSLGALMSEGGGTGITTLAVPPIPRPGSAPLGPRTGSRHLGLGHREDRARRRRANADDLADIARLVGDRTEREYSKTRQPGGGTSISASTRERAILDPSAIRSITPGHGLLLLRSARPIMLTLRPWTERRDAAQLLDDRAAVEDADSKRSRRELVGPCVSLGPELAWSTRRLHRRAAYCNYMASEQWFALRESWVARLGREARPRTSLSGVWC